MSASMWTLVDALKMVRKLQPRVHAINYHLMLGGGVLNTGESDHDLDLFFSPFNGYESNREEVQQILHRVLGVHGKPLRDAPDYHAEDNWHWGDLLKYTVDGKRIDVFIQ